jgi:site-specific recombinase XerD
LDFANHPYLCKGISNTLNYNITTAAKKAGITFKVTAQTFRHSFAVRLFGQKLDFANHPYLCKGLL